MKEHGYCLRLDYCRQHSMTLLNSPILKCRAIIRTDNSSLTLNITKCLLNQIFRGNSELAENLFQLDLDRLLHLEGVIQKAYYFGTNLDLRNISRPSYNSYDCCKVLVYLRTGAATFLTSECFFGFFPLVFDISKQVLYSI